MSTLDTALEKATAPKDARTVLDLIRGMEPELVKSLQDEAGAAILIRHYLNAIRYNPTLRQCTAESLVAALLLSAQVRLEPGPLGHVYLVPFKNGKTGAHEVVWMLGYTGILQLARRGGAKALRASIVWDNDEWTGIMNVNGALRYTLISADDHNDAQRVGVLVEWKDEGVQAAVFCPPARVDTAVKASRNPKASELRNEDWYWRKTGVRFARPWLPLSADAEGSRFAQASAADGARVWAVDVDETGAAVAEIEAGDE